MGSPDLPERPCWGDSAHTWYYDLDREGYVVQRTVTADVCTACHERPATGSIADDPYKHRVHSTGSLLPKKRIRVCDECKSLHESGRA